MPKTGRSALPKRSAGKCRVPFGEGCHHTSAAMIRDWRCVIQNGAGNAKLATVRPPAADRPRG